MDLKELNEQITLLENRVKDTKKLYWILSGMNLTYELEKQHEKFLVTTLRMHKYEDE